jgi:FixJ family two-component response regulator
MGLPTIHPVVTNPGMPLSMAKVDAGVAVHNGVRSSTVWRGTPTVFVVDDDFSVLESLELLICNTGWQLETFGSAQEFMCREQVLVPSCLVLDIALPGLNGLDLQKRLAVDRKDIPIIFVTDQCDVGIAVQAMKAGAFDFFAKPFCDDALLSAVQQAIERSTTALDHEVKRRGLRARYALLSRREREVMELVVSGLLNKQVSFELGISEITVKAHRGQVMRKMKASSLADLVKMAVELDVSPPALGTLCGAELRKQSTNAIADVIEGSLGGKRTAHHPTGQWLRRASSSASYGTGQAPCGLCPHEPVACSPGSVAPARCGSSAHPG